MKGRMNREEALKILGLREGVSPEDIKRKYRKFAAKYHPDRNVGDKKAEVKFKEISEAYQFLAGSRCSDKQAHPGLYESLISLYNGVLGGLIELGQDPSQVDLIAEMKKMVKSAITEQKNQLQKIEKKIKLLSKVVGRWSVPDGVPPLFEDSTRLQLEACKANLNEMKDRLVLYEATLAYLADCKYDVESGFGWGQLMGASSHSYQTVTTSVS